MFSIKEVTQTGPSEITIKVQFPHNFHGLGDPDVLLFQKLLFLLDDSLGRVFWWTPLYDDFSSFLSELEEA